MFLSEVHEQLCAAEFSKLVEGDGVALKPESLPKINAVIQAGINDLNKKFSIRENEVLVRTVAGKEVYELIPANAVSSNNPDAFIIDSPSDPFAGDIMQIFRITDATGKSLWLNTDVACLVSNDNFFGNRPSIFDYSGVNMLSYNTLKLHGNSVLGDILVQYKAKMKPMDLSLDPKDIYIDLPDHFINALVLYVASRRYNPMGAETIGRGMFHEGNNYWSKYQEEVADLKANLGSIASTGETTNFIRNGWV